ncbi:Uncharacterised protein [Mycobacteroides abscessus subsp. massiliense]|nr:Uncharacterised protein [Mycobacteroides abscessus subsp. massiliense]
MTLALLELTGHHHTERAVYEKLVRSVQAVDQIATVIFARDLAHMPKQLVDEHKLLLAILCGVRQGPITLLARRSSYCAISVDHHGRVSTPCGCPAPFSGAGHPSRC